MAHPGLGWRLLHPGAFPYRLKASLSICTRPPALSTSPFHRNTRFDIFPLLRESEDTAQSLAGATASTSR